MLVKLWSPDTRRLEEERSPGATCGARGASELPLLHLVGCVCASDLRLVVTSCPCSFALVLNGPL